MGRSFFSSEPAGQPTIAVTPSGRIHVMWVSGRGLDQPLWYSQSLASTGWQTATLLSGPQAASAPRLQIAQGQTDETVHAVWVEYIEKNGGAANVINYARRVGADCAPGDCDWPLAIYPSVFDACPPLCEADKPSVYITQTQHGEQTSPVVHAIWNQRRGNDPPWLISGVVSDTWKVDPAAALIAQVAADGYEGGFPQVTLALTGEKRLLWEGRSLAFPNQRIIKWGYNQGNGGTINWTAPARVSTNLLKTDVPALPGCEQRQATAPSVTVSPTGEMHAVWHEQWPNCDFNVFTSRLDNVSKQWGDIEAVSDGRSQPAGSAADSLPPRMVIDRAGRRFVMWNQNYTKIFLTGEDSYGHWQTLELNVGQCEGQTNILGWKVHAFDLAVGPDGTLHAVWTALLSDPPDTPVDRGKICYASLKPTYWVALPMIVQQAGLGSHR